MGSLIRIRDRLTIDSSQSVGISVQIGMDSGEERVIEVAWFECLSCGDYFDWVDDAERFECPSCGYELTSQEGRNLCDLHIRIIEHLKGKAKRQARTGIVWRFLRLLGATKMGPNR